MSRRVVMAVALAGIVVGGAGASYADSTGHDSKPQHELCLLFSQDPNHSTTQDYCVTWPGPVGIQ